jgi:predicted RecB family nuclease
VSERKLRKKEVMIVSRILDEVNFKHYAEYLLSTKLDKVLSKSEGQKEKVLVVVIDVFAFVLQNMYKAESSIDKLIMSYKGLNQSEIDNLEEDEFIEVLKDIFIAGVPKVISKMVDLSEFKKKFQEIKKTINQPTEK